MDKSYVTFQSSVSGSGEFGLRVFALYAKNWMIRIDLFQVILLSFGWNMEARFFANIFLTC